MAKVLPVASHEGRNDLARVIYQLRLNHPLHRDQLILRTVTVLKAVYQENMSLVIPLYQSNDSSYVAFLSSELSFVFETNLSVTSIFSAPAL